MVEGYWNEEQHKAAYEKEINKRENKIKRVESITKQNTPPPKLETYTSRRSQEEILSEARRGYYKDKVRGYATRFFGGVKSLAQNIDKGYKQAPIKKGKKKKGINKTSRGFGVPMYSKNDQFSSMFKF